MFWSIFSAQGEASSYSSLPLLVKGLVLGIFLSLVLLLVITLVMFFTPLPEMITPYLIFASTLLGIMYGSYFVGQRVDEKGWLRGGLVGFFYVVVLFLVSIFFPVAVPFSFDIVIKLFLGFVFGAAGGILGINR